MNPFMFLFYDFYGFWSGTASFFASFFLRVAQVGNRSVRDRIATPYVPASVATNEAAWSWVL